MVGLSFKHELAYANSRSFACFAHCSYVVRAGDLSLRIFLGETIPNIQPSVKTGSGESFQLFG
jgi:hypothetical protein